MADYSDNSECPNCGNPIESGRADACPKCGESLRDRVYRPLLEMDVAHSGETLEEAQQKITEAVDRGLRDGHKGVKIIHGHGASSGRAVIRKHAVKWLRELAAKTGGKLVQDKNNPGAHILWLD